MGFGNFSEPRRNRHDAAQRQSPAAFEVYDISNNQITGATFMGTVGLELAGRRLRQFQQPRRQRHAPAQHQHRRIGGLRHQQQSDHRRRLHGHGRAGLAGRPASAISAASPAKPTCCCATPTPAGFEVYDITNNQITGAAFLGTVGLDWQFAGIAPVHAAGASDLVLRNVNTGAFEVYDIANNQLTGAASLGQVGLDWQLGGFAADPPTGTATSADTSSSYGTASSLGFSSGGASATVSPFHATPDFGRIFQPAGRLRVGASTGRLRACMS